MMILKAGKNIKIIFENSIEPLCFHHSYSNEKHFLHLQEFLLEHGFITEKDKISFEEYQKKFREYYF